MRSQTRVVIATAYDIIYREIAAALARESVAVVGLVTRAGAGGALSAANPQLASVPVTELPVRPGEMSIPKGMDACAEYRERVLRQIAGVACVEFDYLVAWGINVLPAELLRLARRRALNVHPSGLPNYRGGFPFQAQLLNEETSMRVTIHETTLSIDKGHQFAITDPIAILPSDGMRSLVDRAVPVGAAALARVVRALEAGLTPEHASTEPADPAKHAWGIHRAMDPAADPLGPAPGSNLGVLGHYAIHWDVDRFPKIERCVRAFDMMGGPFTALQGKAIHLAAVDLVDRSTGRDPGEILEVDAESVTAQAIDGVVRFKYRTAHDLRGQIGQLRAGDRCFDSSVSVEAVTGFRNADRIFNAGRSQNASLHL